MAGRFDLKKTTLRQLLNDPEASAIILELVPDLPNKPMIGLVKGMPAAAVINLASAELPAETVADLKARIEAL
ncbi:hypothetical protein [Microbacterium sp. GXF7504]